jgi:GNAT superfamily N-acetyltransferase
MTEPNTRIAVGQGGEYDVEPVVALFTVAFMDDPLARWLIPDTQARMEVLPAYLRIFVEHALHDRGGSIELSPDVDAAALWFALQADTTPRIPGYKEQLVRAVGGARLARFLLLDQARHNHHPGRLGHDYLAFAAVHPDQQRRGLGTALLQPRLRLLDARGQPAYAEATNARTAAWLQQQGYQGQAPYQPAPDSPWLLPLWRPAATGDRDRR